MNVLAPMWKWHHYSIQLCANYSLFAQFPRHYPPVFSLLYDTGGWFLLIASPTFLLGFFQFRDDKGLVSSRTLEGWLRKIPEHFFSPHSLGLSLYLLTANTPHKALLHNSSFYGAEITLFLPPGPFTSKHGNSFSFCLDFECLSLPYFLTFPHCSVDHCSMQTFSHKPSGVNYAFSWNLTGRS